MSAVSGGDDMDEDTKRRLVQSVENGNETKVVEILDKIDWHVLHSVSFAYMLYGDKDTGTLLHVACCYKKPKLVKLFLERKAIPDEKSREEHHSPLHLSAMRGDAESCALLISYCCTVDAVDVKGKTPLQRASLHGEDDVVKFLIKHNADVNHGDDLGLRPLHSACLTGQTSTVQILADCGADIDCQENGEPTPLHYACLHGRTDTVKLLVTLGADVTIADYEQETLYYAVTGGYLQTACALISSIPDTTLVNDTLRRNLDLALNEKSLELLSFVCAHGALESADGTAKRKVVEFAVESISHDLQSPTNLGSAAITSLFAQVVDEGAVHSAIILLSACDLEGVPDDVMGKVLHLAVSKGSPELALSFFKTSDACNGGELNTASPETVRGILQLGLECESANLVALVLALDQIQAAVSSMTSALRGQLLQFAMQQMSARFALEACKAGAMAGASSTTGKTMLAFALEKGSVELASMAFKAGAYSSASKEDRDLMQATLELASRTPCVELATAASQQGALDDASPNLMHDLLKLGLQSECVELVLAVASKPATFTSTISTTPADVLQFAVKHALPELAVIACKAGAVTQADSQLLSGALEMAVQKSSKELLSILCETGALRQSSDNMKEKVMHLAAIFGDLQLADHCISSGALHGAEHWDQPTAIEVAAQRGHSRLAEKLRKALDNHKLLSLGQREANTILIRVVGSPGAGKSTLVDSLRTSRLWGFFRWESQADKDDRNFQTRTRGIQVDSYEDRNGTLCRILDLGGQEDFAAANQLFIGEGQIPIINIITTSAIKRFDDMEEEILKWSAFFASRHDNKTFRQKPDRQPVLVVATRSESASPTQMENVDKAANRAKRSFRQFLDFQHGSICLDARKSWSQEMKQLRNLLAEKTKTILKRAPPQAALCNDIQRALPWIRANMKQPIVLRDQLPELVAQGLSTWRRSFDKTVIQSHTVLLDAALRQMSDACEIISFDTPKLKEVLVIRPPWLLHDVIGILLSPANFQPPRILYDQAGQANRKQAEDALEANLGQVLEKGATLQMVAQLGLCILEDDSNCSEDEGIVVPSKLETVRNLDAILSAGDLTTIWFGIELLCSEVPLSVCLFPQLQVHLFNFLRKYCKHRPIMWSGGIAAALPHEQVVGIVEARRGQMAIDIIVQGTEATRQTCFRMLQVLKEQTLLKVQKFSPGSDIVEKILSSRELSSLDWTDSKNAPRITYERSYAEEAMESEHGKIRPQYDDASLVVLEDAFNLMAIPLTHACLMTTDGYQRFCHEMNSSPPSGEKSAKWTELAHRLGMPPHKVPSVDSASTINPTDVILQWWSRRSAHHSINRLLEAVHGLGHPEAAAILERELTLSMKTLPGNSEQSTKPDRGGNPLASNKENTPPQTASPPSILEHSPSCADHVTAHSSSPASVMAGSSSPPPVTAHSSPPAVVTTHSSLPAPVIAHSLSPAPVTTHSSSLAPVTEHSSSPPHVQGHISLPGNHFWEDHDDGGAADVNVQLMEAAKSFYDTFQCKQLAVYLNVSQGGRIVSSLQNSNPGVTIAEIAFKIMMAWKKENGEAATIEELQRVLYHKLKMVDTVEHVWHSDPTSAAHSSLQPKPGSKETTHQSPVGSVAETTIMDIALSFSEPYSCQELAENIARCKVRGKLEPACHQLWESVWCPDGVEEGKEKRGNRRVALQSTAQPAEDGGPCRKVWRGTLWRRAPVLLTITADVYSSPVECSTRSSEHLQHQTWTPNS